MPSLMVACNCSEWQILTMCRSRPLVSLEGPGHEPTGLALQGLEGLSHYLMKSIIAESTSTWLRQATIFRCMYEYGVHYNCVSYIDMSNDELIARCLQGTSLCCHSWVKGALCGLCVCLLSFWSSKRSLSSTNANSACLLVSLGGQLPYCS